MGLFDLNDKIEITVENFMGSNIYYIDNFFINPDDICGFLDKEKSFLFESYTHPMVKNLNGEYFFDSRNELRRDDVAHVYDLLEKISGHESTVNDSKNTIRTNLSLLKKHSFNDYKSNYWHPHFDLGYTALVYLNKDDESCGTNLYKNIKPDPLEWCGEHAHPWSPHKYWKLLKSIKPKYNRCVLFDGKTFLHGMNIENDRYFNSEFRRNLVFFFKSK